MAAWSTARYSRYVRPVLFRMPAETAHSLAKSAMRRPNAWSLLAPGVVDDPRLMMEAGGIRLRNPVGLAPGFDKDGELLDVVERLGFGYQVAGTVRDRNVQNSSRPNLIRLVNQESLIN